MPSSPVEKWFGERFSDLHPLLQDLHLNGGRLVGDVHLSYGAGLAGILGARIANRLGLPVAGQHRLVVSISHDGEALHWARTFDGSAPVVSIFSPVGEIQNGYWVERTKALTFRLTVDVREQGWYWRCLSVRLFRVPIPMFLLPETKAFKKIENGGYRFYVGFAWPLLGSLVSYQGILNPEKA